MRGVLVLVALCTWVALSCGVNAVKNTKDDDIWCRGALKTCTKRASSSSSATVSRCDQKVLLLLLSEHSTAFGLIASALKESSRVQLLANSRTVEACSNMSASVSAFNSFTGDPFTHNPFDIHEVFHNIQDICLKNLNIKDVDSSAERSPSSTERGVHHSHIIAFPYSFPSFEQVQGLLSTFPCTRAVVSKRHANTPRLRSLKREVEVFSISPMRPEPVELEAVLLWLGLDT